MAKSLREKKKIASRRSLRNPIRCFDQDARFRLGNNEVDLISEQPTSLATVIEAFSAGGGRANFEFLIKKR